jgi:hypothetical protein
LNKRSMILSLLLVSLFTGLSLGQTDNNASIAQTISTNESTSANETAAVNATQAGTESNLNYIWSITGIEVGSITMALTQEGSELYGQAKYEPEGGKAWNANVVGSVTENEVELTLTAQKDKESITTKMTGAFAADTINGNFTQISAGKKVGSGSFSAMWISPDVSSYTPATIEEPKVETAAPDVVENTAASNASDEQTTPTVKKKYFTDVNEFADKIGPGGDLSGVPPGMGGAL